MSWLEHSWPWLTSLAASISAIVGYLVRRNSKGSRGLWQKWRAFVQVYSALADCQNDMIGKDKQITDLLVQVERAQSQRDHVLEYLDRLIQSADRVNQAVEMGLLHVSMNSPSEPSGSRISSENSPIKQKKQPATHSASHQTEIPTNDGEQ